MTIKVSTSVVKQDVHRIERIRGLLEYSFDVCNAFGEVWISEDEQACALILLPDKKRTRFRVPYYDHCLHSVVYPPIKEGIQHPPESCPKSGTAYRIEIVENLILPQGNLKL